MLVLAQESGGFEEMRWCEGTGQYRKHLRLAASNPAQLTSFKPGFLLCITWTESPYCRIILRIRENARTRSTVDMYYVAVDTMPDISE